MFTEERLFDDIPTNLQIVPLFSQSSHPLPADLKQESIDAIINRVQFGGDEVVQAKAGAGSATLSMAFAGAQFAEKVIRALKGEKGIVTPSFVHLTADVEGGKALQSELGGTVQYFSSNVELGVSVSHFFTQLRTLRSWRCLSLMGLIKSILLAS